jgi:hypothetical protein
MRYHVYSPLLEGYISMEHPTQEDAEKFIRDYHDRGEARQMTVIAAPDRRDQCEQTQT